MKIVYQHDERDCASACLSMIAAHFGLKQPISVYRELTKTDRMGASFYGIVEGADKIGLKANALCGSSSELMEDINNKKIKFPFIAHVISENLMLHYIVVFGMKNNVFIIGDPGKGKLKIHVSDFFELWTGNIVTFEKTENFKKGNTQRKGIFKFFRLLIGQYKRMAGILVLSVAIALIGILGAFVFEIVIDDFTYINSVYETYVGDEETEIEAYEGNDESHEGHEHGNGFLSRLEASLEYISDKTSISSFNTVFLVIIAFYLLQMFIQFVRGYLIISLSKKIDLSLSLSYYNHLIGLPVSSLTLRQTGEYISRFSDTDIIRKAISEATLTIILDFLMVLGCGIILFYQNKNLFLLALLMTMFYAFVVIIYRKPLERSNRNVMEQDAIVQSYFKESIDAIETVKASNADGEVKSKGCGKMKELVESAFKNSLLSMSQDTLSSSIELIGTVIILWLGFAMVLDSKITVGELMTFYALMAYFTEPVKNLIGLQPEIQNALIAVERLNDILDLKTEDIKEDGEKLNRIYTCEMKDIKFRYGNSELMLNGASIKARKGEKIAVIGESGSGKTTLAKLLLRFYEAESGEILINGTKLDRFRLDEIREKICYVDQKAFLFADTVRNNLCFGNESVSDEEIMEACKKANVDEFIDSLPFGLDTPLDEKGGNLSDGQRQRLAIVRAILKKPEILILDEATSNLDAFAENSIGKALSQMSENMILIVIAHRLSSAKKCDRIYIMDRGRTVQSGTHDDLLKSSEIYAGLWENQ